MQSKIPTPVTQRALRAIIRRSFGGSQARLSRACGLDTAETSRMVTGARPANLAFVRRATGGLEMQAAGRLLAAFLADILATFPAGVAAVARTSGRIEPRRRGVSLEPGRTHHPDSPAGRRHHCATVVVAEGANPVGGGVTLKAAATAGRVERLGGVGEIVADQLRELTGKETRSVVLGHVLRGGQPGSRDRSLGLIVGAAAVRALVEGHGGVMITVDLPRNEHVPRRGATAKLKLVAPDGCGMRAARARGIWFGDQRQGQESAAFLSRAVR